MGMILRIASSRIVGQGDIVGRSGYFSLNLSDNSEMRGRLDARRTLKSLVADLRFHKSKAMAVHSFCKTKKNFRKEGRRRLQKSFCRKNRILLWECVMSGRMMPLIFGIIL